MLSLYLLSQIGPHSLSVGNAYAAYYGRVEAISYNPAAAAIASRAMVSLYHSGYGYNGGGFVYPNRILSFGVHLAKSSDLLSGQIAIGRSFGTLNIGVGTSFFRGDTSNASLYAGAAFFPLDYFVFGFGLYDIHKPSQLYSKVGLYVSSIPVPFFGRSLNLYTSMNVKFNSREQEQFNVGLEFQPVPYLFLRTGRDGSGSWKAGLGFMYVANTSDILLDLGVDSLSSQNRVYAIGVTVKFLGYTVWVESSPKVIELEPGTDYNVVKICMRHNLPEEVEKWVLRITNRWGKEYKVFYGDGPIPDECIYWHGTDEYGNYVKKGVYYYHFIVKGKSGKIYERKGGLVNIKKGVGQ